MNDSDSALQGPKRPTGYRAFLFVILFVSFYLTYLILSPFFDTIILAIVLASIFHRLQVYLVRRFRGRKNLAAACIVFIITFAIALPVAFFTTTLVAQGVDTLNRITEWLREGNLQKLTEDPRINENIAWFHEHFPFLELNKSNITNDIMSLSKNLGQFMLTKAAAIAGNLADLLAHFFMMIFIAFYLVRDGQEMIQHARYYSPLKAEQEDRIFDGIRVVTKSVLLGTFLTAVCQGVAAGIALKIVGFPGLFWGTISAIASLIPLVGTYLVSVPIVIYLILLGQFKWAVFLAIWSVIFSGVIDNMVRPFLMKGKSKMSPFYIFLAILGGVQYFGLKGILYGPLILTFAMIMLVIYGVEYRDELTHNKSVFAPGDNI